jgi:hypothetical protein
MNSGSEGNWTEQGRGEMSFRRSRDEWDEFLKLHGGELRTCGVPDDLTRDKGRFLVFLDHGYDDWGQATCPTATPWGPQFLTPGQCGRLGDFIATHFGEHDYRFLLRDLRTRAGGR